MKNYIYIIIFVALFSSFSNAQNFAESPKKSSDAEVKSGDENFDRIFRQARELMDNEEWAKAVEKFNQIVCDCPEKKQVDAALYWLAYCYKKQKMFKETNVAIERLLKNFPDSSWADDARVLSFQTYAISPKPTVASVGRGQSYSGNAPFVIANQNLLTTTIAGTYNLSPVTQLDREDEIKLAAFQSLLAADQKRAIEKIGDILRSDSKASETLKIQIIRSLQRSHYFLNQGFGTFSTSELTPATVVTQINPLLREALAKGYQSDPNPKIRTEILYAISNINDEASVNYLAQLYSAESNKDLKKAIINSFAGSSYAFYTTGYAVSPKAKTERVLVEQKAQSGQATAKTTVGSAGGTRVVNSDGANPVRKLRLDKLMEIFRNEKDLELKRLAFNSLQRFVGWSNRDGMVDMLVQMYEAETDDSFKVSIISSFSSLPKNTQATNKLIEIAKNDKSDKMRLEAIRALRNNNSPEVIKLLEDLIK